MRIVEAILVVVLLVGILVGLVCGLVAFTLGEPPAVLGVVSAGTVALATALLSLGAAVSKGGSLDKWHGSDVKVGRFSLFAFGIVGCALGVAFLGYHLLPERYLGWTVVVAIAGFALGLFGQWLDGRAYEWGIRQHRHATESPGPAVPDSAADAEAGTVAGHGCQ